MNVPVYEAGDVSKFDTSHWHSKGGKDNLYYLSNYELVQDEHNQAFFGDDDPATAVELAEAIDGFYVKFIFNLVRFYRVKLT